MELTEKDWVWWTISPFTSGISPRSIFGLVYARDIDHLQIQDSNVTVHWLGDDPDIQDLGADNTTGRLTQ